ncbi:DNA polymerase subunit gamma-2, mitochondrial [Ostrinia nubilalis]|uniref:DNA polymerase subunit gamma-2, mitochondrial n=1 Tax=Ostrinia nubilalis TaxID=29057 RepID=UPI00308225F9
MKTELEKVLNLRKFFTINKSTNTTIIYNLSKSSLLFLQNIYISWLQSVCTKTNKHMPVFITKKYAEDHIQDQPFGFLENHVIKYDESAVLHHDIEDCAPKNTSLLQLNMIVPHHTSMQYFIQWQRHRKYWWSSVTTTPSLFAVNEFKYEKETAESNIVAQFPWGHHTVETVSMTSRGTEDYSHLKCSMSLERAMFILLLDGMMNKRDSEYLKLHRNMTPYKISFALNTKEKTDLTNMNGLVNLMRQRLKSKDISSYLPDLTLALEEQIKENLQLGVTYTAILCDNTLTNGIFNLLNSSTMLTEEVHVADFDSYAMLLCRK